MPDSDPNRGEVKLEPSPQNLWSSLSIGGLLLHGYGARFAGRWARREVRGALFSPNLRPTWPAGSGVRGSGFQAGR